MYKIFCSVSALVCEDRSIFLYKERRFYFLIIEK